MIWALRDCLDRFGHCRHNSSEIVTEKYLRDLLLILNEVEKKKLKLKFNYFLILILFLEIFTSIVSGYRN